MKKKAAYAIPVLAGIIFCFYYVGLAADNVAFSDYIRLINAYLPDVGNPAKFFVPDILTRVPLTYAARWFNVKFLGYNTLFDIGLGVLGMAVGAAALCQYAKREPRVSYLWYLFALFVYFSLNKWEMLTNGTGWVCFLSISGFYCHYVILDHAVKTGHTVRHDRVLLLILPSLLTLLVAGPYCGGYSAVLLLVYLVMLFCSYRETHRVNRLYAGYLLAVLVPLCLYLWSNSTAVYVHRGAVGGSIVETFFSDPMFFVRFMLKALASAAVGIAQLEAFKQNGSVLGNDGAVYLLGFIVMCLYFYALYLNVRYELYKKTVFPLLLILSGGLNHLLILSARWIFLKESYGMSSRYELQYQMGIIGILLTFSVVKSLWKEEKNGLGAGSPAVIEKPSAQSGSRVLQMSVICFGAILVFAGNFHTTKEELKTAPFRKAYLDISREIALNYRNASDEDLVTYLHNDANEVRKAMEILEENNLNIFAE